LKDTRVDHKIMDWKLNLRLARYDNHFWARLKLRERQPRGTTRYLTSSIEGNQQRIEEISKKP
jgi:Fic family protein